MEFNLELLFSSTDEVGHENGNFIEILLPSFWFTARDNDESILCALLFVLRITTFP